MGVGAQRHAPAALPQGKTRYPLYRRLGGLQGRSGWVQKTSSLPGVDPRTIQLLVSRYPGPHYYYIPSETQEIAERGDDAYIIPGFFQKLFKYLVRHVGCSRAWISTIHWKLCGNLQLHRHLRRLRALL
jgi:hypothetical protein